MMALIAFFLMASGDRFRRKMVKLAGPTLSRKKVTLQALNQIHDQIQRYMLVQLFTSVLVGLATWLSFLALGLENAAVWGIAAGVLDLVPYSEQEDLEIEVTADPAPSETDVDGQRGILAWEFELAAGGKQTITLEQTLSWPEGMVLR